MRMADKPSPERLRLVQRLAKAINRKKRMEKSPAHSTKERLRADEQVTEALEAVRTEKPEEEPRPGKSVLLKGIPKGKTPVQ